MSDVLLLLHVEHNNMARVLDALERQLLRLEAEGRADVGLIASVFDYCMSYPDRCHHPKEDLVFRRLTQRDPAAGRRLADLIAEHQDLARRTREAAAVIDRGPRGLILSPSRFSRLIPPFLDVYRRHMAAEEEAFLPAARDGLTPQDWADLDFCVFDGCDPLFLEPVEQRYAHLRREILDHGSATV